MSTREERARMFILNLFPEMERDMIFISDKDVKDFVDFAQQETLEEEQRHTRTRQKYYSLEFKYDNLRDQIRELRDLINEDIEDVHDNAYHDRKWVLACLDRILNEDDQINSTKTDKSK